MKKLLSVVLSLFLVCSSMLFPVLAHEDCECELHTEEHEIDAVQPRAIVCGHSSSYWDVIATSDSAHTMRCSICGATDDYPHTARTKCESDSCTECGFSFPFVNHITEIAPLCLEDGGETHAYRCTNYWEPTGQCPYYTGEERCSSDEDSEIWYGPAIDGIHRKYIECHVCGIGIFIGNNTCHKTIGETYCPYCG